MVLLFKYHILRVLFAYQIDGLVEDSSNSIANALELLKFCVQPLNTLISYFSVKPMKYLISYS